MFSTKIVNAKFRFSSRKISFQYFRYYYPNISLTINLNKENNANDNFENSKEHVEEKNEIYLSKYSGWYSVSDEAFYSEDEIENVDGKKVSKLSGSAVEWVEEESYFFKLSKWEKPLLDFYKKNHSLHP